jgi:glycosyltransferase involved in cell wall biosynthesis
MITVAICTHNPRTHYLARVLEALREQTLEREEWELLLVDNASSVVLADAWDLSWHPQARHIREDNIGLTNARLRAIGEAIGDVVVFVDDDNVLAADYLAECKRIGMEMAFLGSWGGQQLGEYEVEPAGWMEPYLGYLPVRIFNYARWSNVPTSMETVPVGAGMCVRSGVARFWSDIVRNDSARRSLGRIGSGMGAAEDTDLGMTAYDAGLGTGQFASLRLVHLIPKERLETDYLVRLVEGITYSRSFLHRMRFRPHFIPPNDVFYKFSSLLRKGVREYRLWRLPPEVRKIERARMRGEREGLRTAIGIITRL